MGEVTEVGPLTKMNQLVQKLESGWHLTDTEKAWLLELAARDEQKRDAN